MGVDLFANGALTTVSSGGTTSSTGDNSFVVSNPAAFPVVSNVSVPPTQFRVIDPNAPTEIMLVTNLSGTGGNTWAVTRGAEGTTPVAHAANWTAEQVITAGSLTALLAQVGDTIGTLATRPAATGSGVRYFATDDTGGTESVDTASGVWTNTSKRGLLASASLTASSGTLGTTPALVTGLSVTFTFGARPVKVSLTGNGKCSATGILHTTQLVSGTTPVVQQKAQQAVAANVDFPIDQFVILTGTAGNSLTVNVYAGAASGTCTLDGSTTQPIVLVAEEV